MKIIGEMTTPDGTDFMLEEDSRGSYELRIVTRGDISTCLDSGDLYMLRDFLKEFLPEGSTA